MIWKSLDRRFCLGLRKRFCHGPPHEPSLKESIASATRCIESGYELLLSDRDFDPFAAHLGLRVVE